MEQTSNMLIPSFVKMFLEVLLEATNDVAVSGLKFFTATRQEEAQLRLFSLTHNQASTYQSTHISQLAAEGIALKYEENLSA